MFSCNVDIKSRNYLLQVKCKIRVASGVFLRREYGLEILNSSLISSDMVKLGIMFRITTNPCDIGVWQVKVIFVNIYLSYLYFQTYDLLNAWPFCQRAIVFTSWITSIHYWESNKEHSHYWQSNKEH